MISAYRVRLYKTWFCQIPVAIGIWCRGHDLAAADKIVSSRLTEYPKKGLEQIRDPIRLDEYLADYVSWLCPATVAAAAATLNAWQDGPRTGGIIGSLGGSVGSIDETMTEIMPQVWCLSYSGGPGLLLEGNSKTAWQVREYLEYPGREKSWTDIRKFLKTVSVSVYLYVTDGSGGIGMLAGGDRIGISNVYCNGCH